MRAARIVAVIALAACNETSASTAWVRDQGSPKGFAPGALPALLPPGPEVFTLTIHPAAGMVETYGPAQQPLFDGARWVLGASARPVRFPIQARAGDTITGWRVHVFRDVSGPATVGRLQRLKETTGQHEDVGPVAGDFLSPSGDVSFGASNLSVTIGSGETYSVVVAGNGHPGDNVTSVAVSGVRDERRAWTLVVSPLSAGFTAGWRRDLGGWIEATGFGDKAVVPLFLQEGDRLTSLTLAASGSPVSSADMTVVSAVALKDGTSFHGSIGSLFVPNASHTWTDYQIDLVDTEVVNGDAYWFEVSSDQPGLRVGAFRVTYDRRP